MTDRPDDAGEPRPPAGWPERWWRIYRELHELWDADRLSESRALLDRALPEFGYLPTAKLAEAYQLTYELGSAGDADAAARGRALDLVFEAVGPDEDDPRLLMEAVILTFDLGDWKATKEYVGLLGQGYRELLESDIAALAYVLGCLLARADRRDAAEEQFRAAIELNPDEPVYRAGLAQLLHGQPFEEERPGERWLIRYRATNSSATTPQPATVTLRLPEVPEPPVAS